MKRLIAGSVISLVAILQLASVSFGQDASPKAAAPAGDPLPYASYVADLRAFSENDPFAGLSDPPTKDEIVAGLRTLVVSATAEQDRLMAVVPEACYADAHQELLGYWQSSTELTAETAAQLEAAASIDELSPIVAAMDTELQTRHPIAYVEATDGSGGFQGSPFNILSALATCDSGESSAASPSLESPTP